MALNYAVADGVIFLDNYRNKRVCNSWFKGDKILALYDKDKDGFAEEKLSSLQV